MAKGSFESQIWFQIQTPHTQPKYLRKARLSRFWLFWYTFGVILSGAGPLLRDTVTRISNLTSSSDFSNQTLRKAYNLAFYVFSPFGAFFWTAFIKIAVLVETRSRKIWPKRREDSEKKIYLVKAIANTWSDEKNKQNEIGKLFLRCIKRSHMLYA